MALPVNTRDFDIPLTVGSAATITAGFTIAVGCPTRGEILGVYIVAIDGTAITAGPATLTFTVNNVAGATVACTSAVVGQSSGTSAFQGVSLSARQAVTEGDTIKIVLGAGLTNGANAVVTVLIRARSI